MGTSREGENGNHDSQGPQGRGNGPLGLSRRGPHRGPLGPKSAVAAGQSLGPYTKAEEEEGEEVEERGDEKEEGGKYG